MIRDGWRTGITLLNLLVFLCCYFCLASLAKAANEFGKQDRQDNTLLILSKNVFNPGDSSMKAEDFAPIHELEPQSVAAVAPLIYKLLRIDDYLIQVCGANAADYESVFGLKLSDGTWPSERGEVALSDGAVLLAHWKIGQTIMIYGKPFRISGTVTAAGNRTSSVWMPLAEAERLFNTHGVYQFAWIKVAPNADAGKVKQVLQADTRLNGRFDVFFVNALYQQYANALQDIKDISLVLMGFALVMVMVGTYGSVYLTLSERSREITILRAIGFSTNTLRGLLIFRSLLQVSVAFLLAWGTAEILLAHFEQISPLTINTLPLLVRIDIQVWGWGWLLSALCACLGVWLPTLRLHFLTVRESIQR
jgi:putative ABC transport system permease protein